MYIITVEPEWGFNGAFSVETVKVLFGLRYGRYISITHIVEVPNRHSEPREHFAIYARDVKSYLEDKLVIVGVIHRHPPNLFNPSLNDIIGIKTGIIGGVWCEGDISWYTDKGVTKVRYLS